MTLENGRVCYNNNNNNIIKTVRVENECIFQNSLSLLTRQNRGIFLIIRTKKQHNILYK